MLLPRQVYRTLQRMGPEQIINVVIEHSTRHSTKVAASNGELRVGSIVRLKGEPTWYGLEMFAGDHRVLVSQNIAGEWVVRG